MKTTFVTLLNPRRRRRNQPRGNHRISSKLRSLLLAQLIAPLGFLVGGVHATPLLEGIYSASVNAYLQPGSTADLHEINFQPIVSQTTPLSAGIEAGDLHGGSSLTLGILNDDGSDHARITANTVGNFFRVSGPEMNTFASVTLAFSITEAVNYSIMGSYLFDLEGLSADASWESHLTTGNPSTILYYEQERMQTTGASVMHLDLVNEGTALYTEKGSLTGTLLPGQYTLEYSTSLGGYDSPGTNSGVSSSNFSVDFVKASDTAPNDPPVTNSVPDITPTWVLLGLGLIALVRRHPSQNT